MKQANSQSTYRVWSLDYRHQVIILVVGLLLCKGLVFKCLTTKLLASTDSRLRTAVITLCLSHRIIYVTSCASEMWISEWMNGKLNKLMKFYMRRLTVSICLQPILK